MLASGRRLFASGGGLLTSSRRLLASGRRLFASGRRLLGGGSDGRDADLGNGYSSGDDLGGGASGNGGSLRDARLRNGSLNNDGGVVNCGLSGSASDSDDGSDSLGTSGDSGVLLNVRSADTLEELDRLGDDVAVLTIGVQARENGLDEFLACAVAASIGVVLALCLQVKPSVQTLGENGWARKSLLGSLGSGGVGRLLSGGGRGLALGGGRLSLLTSRARLSLLASGSGLGLSRSLGRSKCLGHRADGGADRDSDSDDMCAMGLSRAVGDLRSAAGDSLD